MLSLDLTGKRAFVAGAGDDKGYGWPERRFLLRDQSDFIWSAELDGTRTRLLVTTRGGRIWLLDADSLEDLTHHWDAGGNHPSVHFSPSGQRIAAYNTRGMIRLWDLEGVSLDAFSGHGSGVSVGCRALPVRPRVSAKARSRQCRSPATSARTGWSPTKKTSDLTIAPCSTPSAAAASAAVRAVSPLFPLKFPYRGEAPEHLCLPPVPNRKIL